MGETAELRNQLSGSFGFNDYIEQGDGEATIRKMLKTMIPTVDLRDFQRRYEFSFQDVTVLVGETFDVLWTVPREQAWRPALIQFNNKDSVNHFVNVIVRMTGGLVLRLTRTDLRPGEPKPIYGTTLDGSITDQVGEFTALAPSPLEPGFQIQIVDTTPLVQASVVQNVIIVYERVPQPATVLTSGPDAVVTVT